MKLLAITISALLCCSVLMASQMKNKNFTIQKDTDGKFWFINPAGNRFLSIGINTITPTVTNHVPNTTFYDALNSQFNGDFEKWNTFVTDLLHKSNFNTLGSWSSNKIHSDGLYSTVILYVAGHSADRCLESLKPGFEASVEKIVTQKIAEQRYPDAIMGFYLDNEMQWFGKSAWDITPNYTLLELALDKPANDPARQQAKKFLIKKYRIPDSFSKAWNVPLDNWDNLTANTLRASLNETSMKDRDEFTEFTAEKFFEISTAVLRKLAPGKLILGVRFAGDAPTGAIKACGRHCDVISYNKYQVEPGVNKKLLARYWNIGQKPVMITEFSWRAKDNTSGCPNNRGAGTVVETQAQRGKNYEKYIAAMYEYPMVVGTHWFEFADQSPQGRFDGENSNYGVVDIYNRPYNDLLDSMAQANKKAYAIHEKSEIKELIDLPVQNSITFEPGQYPDRPPQIDLLREKWINEPELFHAADANINIQKFDANAVVNYDTGSLWGCGFLIFGPEKYALKNGPAYAANLDGYYALEIDWYVPKNVTYEIMVDEAGVDLPEKSSYNMLAGDDAESFTFGNHFGSNQRVISRFEFNNLKPRTSWGNQNGRHILTMNAMKGIGLYMAGGQGDGKIIIYSIKLVR